MPTSDTTLTEILAALAREDHYGVLLAAQLGGTPQEVQLILQTTVMNADQQTISPTGQYIIRAIGVQEHRLAVGLFANLVHSTDNPLLYPHNAAWQQVHFHGTPRDVDDLMLRINQLYGQTYGLYDPFRRMVDELNPTAPLATILQAGDGILGVMPEPFAEKVVGLLGQYELNAHLEPAQPAPEHIRYESLVLDDSYLVASMFSADPITPSGG